jgi:hypothetical protein
VNFDLRYLHRLILFHSPPLPTLATFIVFDLPIMSDIDISHTPSNTSRVPRGFTLIDFPGSHSVLVPTFLVPATEIALETDATKEEMNVDEGAHGVSICFVDISHTHYHNIIMTWV